MGITYKYGPDKMPELLALKAKHGRARLLRGLQLASQLWIPRVFQKMIATSP